MKGEPSADADRLVDVVMRTASALTKSAVRCLSSLPDDVTANDLLLLATLATTGAQTMATLSRSTGLPTPMAHRACSRLVARGLVLSTHASSGSDEVLPVLSTAGVRFRDDVVARGSHVLDALAARLFVGADDLSLAAALDAFTEAATGRARSRRTCSAEASCAGRASGS
jgi:DNA-binding MarR family transcriptional regulator